MSQLERARASCGRAATIYLGAVMACVASARSVRAEPIVVSLEKTDAGWRLLRGGQPFRVNGAGGRGSLALLKAAGGNSTRTWGADDLEPLLDEAHALGLAVTVGIWLGHQRHGFDYSSADQVADQYEQARQAVLRYRNHPALLIWGIGNEMEGFENGDDAAVWSAVNNIASMVKKLDPNHPTMTVTAEIGGDRVKNVHRLCPDIDIMGINAYGGVKSLPRRYREAGGTKPYLVTETGPAGAWEVGKTSWGAPHEPTSSQKASDYSQAHRALAADGELNLGAYVFLWSHKREATATWFGMFLADGRRTAAVDVMSEVWSGAPPKNRVPRMLKVGLKGPEQMEPGAEVEAFAVAIDPEGDALTYAWRLEPEDKEILTGGDAQPEPPALSEAIDENGGKSVTVRMPNAPGGYRLYITVGDPHRGAATANIPLRVLGKVELAAAPALKLPILIYSDAGELGPYAPSGWMGNNRAVTLTLDSEEQPKVGKTCLQVTYADRAGWAGVVWQHPANDWGDKPGGFDWSGAKRLSFWARGKRGGEKVKFGYGIISDEKPFSDSDRAEMEVVLTKEWKRLGFDLAGKRLSRLKSGFYWVAAGQGQPLEFFLDDVRVE